MVLTLSKERSAYSKFLYHLCQQIRTDVGDSVFLHAIFPSIENIPDKMGSKSALTSAQMMCFFVYWYVMRGPR